MSHFVQKIFSTIKASATSKKSDEAKQFRQAKPSCEALEDRVLMTLGLSVYDIDPIRHDESYGRITVVGSDVSDNAQISIDARTSSPSDDQLVVNLRRGGLQYIERFALSGVRQVRFYGYGGNDFFQNNTHISSLAYGNAGKDTLAGGSNADILYGGDHDDYVNGGRGNDYLYGEAGNDWIRGKHGNDYIHGGDDNDTVDGGASNDRIYGGDGKDNLYGGYAGNDWIEGGGGDDILTGGTGHDTVFGQAGNDWVTGDDGNDYLSGGSENDSVFGGAGVDHLYGDGGNDHLYGNTEADFLDGGDGDDLAVGDGGDDLIYGGAGRDTLTGAGGDDVIHGGSGNDAIRGSQDNDILFGGDGWDNIFGGSGDDQLIAGESTSSASDGDDDFLNGEDGVDEFWIGDYKWYTTRYKDHIRDDVKGEKVHRDGGPLSIVKPILRVVSPTTYVQLAIVEWLAKGGIQFDASVPLPPVKFGSYYPFQYYRYH